MKKNLGLKTAIIIATLLVFLYGIFGIPKGVSGESLKAALLKRIHLGLDLKGGTHLILQVMVDEAIAADRDRLVERVKEELRAKNIPFAEVTAVPDHPEQLAVKGVPPNSMGQFRDLAADLYREYLLSSADDGSFLLSMKSTDLATLKERTVTRSIETIRSRVDILGVAEPVIQEHGLGENQILVQLPGLDDPARVRQIMQETGMLEIRQSLGGPYASEQAAREANGGIIPANAVVLPGTATASRATSAEESFYLISRSSVVSGDDIRAARAERDPQTGLPVVSFELKAAAGRRFQQFTSANIGNSLAVILSGKVRQVARINSTISDRGQIEGVGEEEARDLSKLLESGALPASIKYLEDRPVSASLGADSVREGVTAAIVGLVAVMIFMFIYYRGAGVNANLGLVLNLVILLGFLGFSGATLTLPGIAGVILTIGMGVDSNVLIFERIREELRHGKMPGTAVEQGFARAWLTIIDTHVTTIVSALILFLFGSGPVRGFAITLAFGLLANLFTSVFVSRVIFDSILNRHQRGEALSI